MPSRVFQFYLHRDGAVEATGASTDAASTDAAARTDAARTAAARTAGATETAATPGAEVATDAFPDGTGAPWHALQRHVPKRHHQQRR